MGDNGKYLRLFGTLFFSFIGFIVAAALVLLALRVFFGMLSYIPGVTGFFTLLIISVPAALFISVYLIYFYRTRTHPSKAARIISCCIFTAALAAWAYFFVSDIFLFFKYHYNAIADYHSFGMIFLASNVAAIFLVGVLQALTISGLFNISRG